jgi:FkbM family methyltransferase
MYIKKEYKFYKFGQWAYLYLYPLYQPIYFWWKSRKDDDKIRFYKEYVKSGMRVVDIGANVGFYSNVFLKLVGEDGSVHSFEPDKLNFKRLSSNTAKYKNSHKNNVAVSDKSGKIKLYKFALNVEFKTYDTGESTNFTEIDCVSLDDYFKNGETVDLLKTDTEGYDYFVIKGMQELIKRSKRFVLITEFWPYMIKKSGVEPQQFITLLKELGFTIRFIDAEAEQSYIEKINDRFYYTDIIAVKQ